MLFRIQCLIVCCLFCFTFYSFSQSNDSKNTPATKLESFLAKKGELFIKEFHPLGSISDYGKIEMDALIIYKPGDSGAKTKGIRIEITEGGRLEHSNTAFLDLDEIESASKSLSYMIELIKKWAISPPPAYSEVIYRTKGDFEIGFFYDDHKLSAFTSCGYISKAKIFIDTDKLDQLKKYLDDGLAQLK